MFLRKTHWLATCLVAAVALVVTPARSQAGIGVTYPAPGATINGQQFIPYGTYTNNTVPDTATMTNTATGAVFNAGLIWSNGGASGGWYTAFGTLPSGTYTLDVSVGGTSKFVGGLIVP